MGKPIVYCGQCGKSLSEDEFTRGRASVIDHQPYCVECRPIAAPAPVEKALSSSSRRLSVAPKTTRRSAVDPTSASPRALLLGGGLLALIVVIAIVAMISGGKERAPEPAPAPASPPPKPPKVAKPPPAPPPAIPKPSTDVDREMQADREKAQAAQFDRFLAQIREIVEKGWRLDLRRAEIDGMLATAMKSAGHRQTEVQKLKEEFERRASLVAHWRLDEKEGTKAEDATGNDHDGELSNGPAWTAGRIGGALSFDGVDDGVTVRAVEGLSPQAEKGEMTLSAWVKVPRHPAATGQGRTPIVAKGEMGAWEYALYLQASGVFEFALWVPAGTNHVSVGGSKAVIDQWHHVAGVYEKGKSARLYVDGKEVNRSTAFTGSAQAGAGPLCIGRRSDGQFFAGTVDDVRLYRRAVGDEEIKTLFDAGAAGKER